MRTTMPPLLAPRAPAPYRVGAVAGACLGCPCREVDVVAMTIIEKILSSRTRAGRRSRPASIVTCDVDRVVMLDLQFAGGPAPLRVHDPARISVVLDHAAPAPTVLDATSHQRARRFAAEFGIADLFDVGRQGISHQLVLEHALALPGQVMACADSHTCASGVAELRRPRPRAPRDPADRVHRPDVVPGARDGAGGVRRRQAAGHLRQGRVPGDGGRSSAAWRDGRSSSRPTTWTSCRSTSAPPSPPCAPS